MRFSELFLHVHIQLSNLRVGFSMNSLTQFQNWLLFFRYFMYDGMEHYCLEDEHIVNLFSFSKAYGMMGWRVGYVSAPCVLSIFCLGLNCLFNRTLVSYISHSHFNCYCVKYFWTSECSISNLVTVELCKEKSFKC
jgi:hypothetical protein